MERSGFPSFLRFTIRRVEDISVCCNVNDCAEPEEPQVIHLLEVARDGPLHKNVSLAVVADNILNDVSCSHLKSIQTAKVMFGWQMVKNY